MSLQASHVKLESAKPFTPKFKVKLEEECKSMHFGVSFVCNKFVPSPTTLLTFCPTSRFPYILTLDDFMNIFIVSKISKNNQNKNYAFCSVGLRHLHLRKLSIEFECFKCLIITTTTTPLNPSFFFSCVDLIFAFKK